MDSPRWNKIVRKVFGSEARIIFARFFESKKNQVTLLRLDFNGEVREVVAKYFVWGDCRLEWDVLNRAARAGLPVPEPLGIDEPVIFTGVVPGCSGKVICSRDPAALDFSAMGRWVGLFHRAFCNGDGTTTIKGDLMLPNFIFSDGFDLPFGIDFEEARPGEPQEDLSHLLATALTVGKPSAKLAKTRVTGLLTGYREKSSFVVSPEQLILPVARHLETRVGYMPHMEELFTSARDRLIKDGLPGV